MSDSATGLSVEARQHRRQEDEVLDCQIMGDEGYMRYRGTSENPSRTKRTRRSDPRCSAMTASSQQRRRRLRTATTAFLCASALLSSTHCSAFVASPFGGTAAHSRKSQAAVAAATVMTESVRKRRGDFVSTTADVAIAKSKVVLASPKNGIASIGSLPTPQSLTQVTAVSKKVSKKRKKKKMAQEPPVVLAAVAASQPKKQKKQAVLEAAAKAAVAEMNVQTEETPTFGRNVFQTFSPSYSESSYDFIESSSSSTTTASPNQNNGKKIVNTNEDKNKTNGKQNKEKNGINKKIARLLVDDDGEEDDFAPDDSLEAANQLADRAAFARMSEEAKIKASLAVKKRNKIYTVMEEENISLGTGGATRSPQTRNGNGVKVDQAVKVASNNGKVTRKEYMILEEKRQNRQRKTKTVHATVSETGSDTMGKYAKSMANHELLRKEDEVVLGRQIQILVKWEEERQKLEDELNRPPTFAQWADKLNTTVPLLKKQIRRSQRAKAAFIEANLRLVVTVARQTVKKNRSEINFQDACQEGIIGLTRACEKFDPERGFRFSTYAIWWVKKEIHKNVVEQSRTVRLPANAMKKINDIRINERILMDEFGRRPTDEELAKKCGLSVERLEFYRNAARDVASLDKTIQARQGKGSSASGEENSKGTSMADLNAKDTSPSPTDLASSQMLREDVRRLIKTLTPKEQAVIRLRFGIDDGTPRTLEDIGKKFSVEKERIRKIEARALLKLRQPYRNQSVKCYIPDI